MKKEYESEALMVCHQSAESLFRLGIINADEMKEFDEGCLIQEQESDQIHTPEATHEIQHATA